MDRLLKAYSGDKASGYDDRRARSKRWEQETAVMLEFLAKVEPSSLVDCPFGTGRWIPYYEAFGAKKVIGIDLSRDMLQQSKRKLEELSIDRTQAYRLIEASIYDVTQEMIGIEPDLVVCVRFLNWVSLLEAEHALLALSKLGCKNVILGISVVPEGTNLVRRLIYSLALRLTNLSRRRKQYVHEESKIFEILARVGWRVTNKAEIMRRLSRKNFFYLVEPQGKTTTVEG
jgi:ubiquinone/menaquinone biosynthesis C-methylase UbiE